MNKLFPYIICGLLLASCSKRDEVDAPVFEVAANGSTFKLGDSIIFQFTGTPQNIVFWPGTPGRVYEFRERTFTTGNKLLVKFNTWQQFGIRNNMTVLVSNDFNGVYDTTNVKLATWTDVTSRFTLSSGVDQTPSGSVDLSEFINNNKAATLAFRYVTPALAAPNRWVVRTFNADNQSPDGVITPMATMSTAAWKAISFVNPASNWSITSSQLLSQAAANNADDDWVLSKSFNPNTATPDKGIAIKNITTNLTRYAPATDLFNKAGTYKVVFEASNASYQNMPARVLKELTITITP